uniref:Putative secreted protein n=1 Tax=Anopheles darlingi TaxID=43151 RepID=A0A2M4DN10_ANODA
MCMADTMHDTPLLVACCLLTFHFTLAMNEEGNWLFLLALTPRATSNHRCKKGHKMVRLRLLVKWDWIGTFQSNGPPGY